VFGVGEILSALGTLRDLSYDSVFHVGDTALQFTADVIRGPDDMRYGKYAYRQIEKQQRRILKQAAKPKIVEKPLKFEEKKAFAELMKRQQGETIIEHWKRQKRLLAYPNKQQLVKDYHTVNQKLEKAVKQQDTSKLEAQFRAISRASQSAGQSSGHKSSGQKP